MIKALQTLLVLTFCAVALEATAQVTGISIETVMVHDGSIDASLEGYTTYRIYADVSSEFDFVSSVFGDATNPLMLGCDGSIFQDWINYNYGDEVNELFFAVSPSSEYDSWLTIGADDATQGVNVQSTDATMAPALAMFNAGEGFVINDPFGATWFNIYPCAGAPDLAACAGTNPVFGGSDNKVLLAQITPNVNGIPGCQYAFASNFNALATVDDGNCELAGCTEMAACNFNSFATTDDGSCDFACLGCTYEGAVNFTANATLDDGTCLFELSVGCALDTDNDGLVGTTDLLELLAYFGLTCE